jgi:hypothetical protein
MTDIDLTIPHHYIVVDEEHNIVRFGSATPYDAYFQKVNETDDVYLCAERPSGVDNDIKNLKVIAKVSAPVK